MCCKFFYLLPKTKHPARRAFFYPATHDKHPETDI